MNEVKNCIRCGGTNLKSGSFQSTGKVYFRAKGSKVLTVHTSGVPVNAIGCYDCGHVELILDTKKAKALAKES